MEGADLKRLYLWLWLCSSLCGSSHSASLFFFAPQPASSTRLQPCVLPAPAVPLGLGLDPGHEVNIILSNFLHPLGEYMGLGEEGGQQRLPILKPLSWAFPSRPIVDLIGAMETQSEPSELELDDVVITNPHIEAILENEDWIEDAS